MLLPLPWTQVLQKYSHPSFIHHAVSEKAVGQLMRDVVPSLDSSAISSSATHSVAVNHPVQLHFTVQQWHERRRVYHGFERNNASMNAISVIREKVFLYVHCVALIVSIDIAIVLFIAVANETLKESRIQ